jgi:uncharacterized protein
MNRITRSELRDPAGFSADLDKLQAEAKRMVAVTPKQERPEIPQTEMQALSRTLGLPTDGSVTLTVAADEMICRATFLPPTLGGKPLSPDTVAAELQICEVDTGIDWEVVRESVFGCNTEPQEISDVVVAAGTLPTDEIPAHLELIEHDGTGDLILDAQAMDTDEVVDHRRRSTLRIVEEGEAIARLVPKRVGKFGSTVTGKAIPFRRIQDLELKPGKNISLNGAEAIASSPGTLKVDEQSFWVEEVLVVKGDIGYGTGHIQFPGDIVLNGEVQDGFIVKGGGDIFCAATLDASMIECRKDLKVRNGIIGRQDASVRVGGCVQTKFVEKCHLDAGGEIRVSSGVLHSVVRCLDHITGGKGSVVIGSEITAQKGLEVHQIGSESGPPSEIIIGVDFRVKERIEWIRDRNIELAMKLASVNQRLDAHPDDKAAAEIRDKIKASIHEMNIAAQQLVPQLDKDDEGYVVVHGKVFPGTSIEICHVPFVVTKEMNRVRFHLNKAAGRIEVEKI